MKREILSVGNVLLVAIGLVVLVVLHDAVSSWSEEHPNISMVSSTGNHREPGVLTIKVFEGWNEKNVQFVDLYIDGTLDSVRLRREEIDSSSPDWETWNQRYLQIREALGLKKDPNE